MAYKPRQKPDESGSQQSGAPSNNPASEPKKKTKVEEGKGMTRRHALWILGGAGAATALAAGGYGVSKLVDGDDDDGDSTDKQPEPEIPEIPTEITFEAGIKVVSRNADTDQLWAVFPEGKNALVTDSFGRKFQIEKMTFLDGQNYVAPGVMEGRAEVLIRNPKNKKEDKTKEYWKYILRGNVVGDAQGTKQTMVADYKDTVIIEEN